MPNCPLCGAEDSMDQDIDPRCINCENFLYDFKKEIGYCTEDEENPIPVDEAECDLLED